MDSILFSAYTFPLLKQHFKGTVNRTQFPLILFCQSGKTDKRGIPQLRYIYRDCGIYSVSMSSAFFF